jgi:hypothetical protein
LIPNKKPSLREMAFCWMVFAKNGLWKKPACPKGVSKSQGGLCDLL